MNSKWERVDCLGSTNYVLHGDGFYVSFNPDPGLGLFGSLFAADDGGAETALISDGEFLVLNGDYRASYERLVPEGLAACRAFYEQQATHADSSWTTRRDAIN